MKTQYGRKCIKYYVTKSHCTIKHSEYLLKNGYVVEVVVTSHKQLGYRKATIVVKGEFFDIEFAEVPHFRVEEILDFIETWEVLEDF